MPAQLHLIPPPPRFRPLQRAQRRPFRPAPEAGAYRLPREVRDRLEAALAPFRNREAAFALARFLARFWSAPGRLERTFPVDRRALADRADLGLSEARVRGGLRTLERIGFLDRCEPERGSKHRLTPAGALHRKVIPYRIGLDYLPAFLTANKRAAAARKRHGAQRRPITPAASCRPSTPPLASAYKPSGEAPGLNSPKDTRSEADRFLMGELAKAPSASPLESHLGTALDRLLKGIRESRSS